MLVDNGMRVLWLARTGWMQSGVPHCLAETVAQHTFIASLIALDLFPKVRASGKDFSEGKVLKMILVHDLAEGFSGDLPKWTKDLIEREELEEEAMSRMNLPDEISEILRDYLTMGTYEAKIARLADLMATWRMAIYYKQLGYDVDDILKSSQKESIELARKLGILMEDG
ncbi:MAG: HD domain-containing protein [Candidatus Korarchaeum sp.]|nr:HD domain-containing protein [Candidatus Korarchaeum sp.]MDW8035939.1 HD domain-containing protein [Candidatus Korarchaeum sp.]